MKNPKFLRPSPFYKLFASDIVANSNYRFMGIDERGLLFSMMNEYWISDALPSDIKLLSKILGFTKEQIMKAKTENVMSFFYEDEGTIKCKELSLYKEQLKEQRLLMSFGGIKGQLTKQYNAKQISEVDFKDKLEDTLKATDMIRNNMNRSEITESGLKKIEVDREEFQKKFRETVLKSGIKCEFEKTES